ncbi:hypothetical protein THAOC_15747 [Thalassiosira oceanica]|uniref:Uncharacterized protein n=1 Tax=Thalassiosira oceanica TaxID=159749 RepID=K0SRD9_THAOC|nr:hypothetical protein THAOC_15747 [Thalassiosira oceanica]|eukprot:EJK63586.1 hypothetical protein THAOC_15747 [Thalassiosira oceanica]
MRAFGLRAASSLRAMTVYSRQELKQVEQLSERGCKDGVRRQPAGWSRPVWALGQAPAEQSPHPQRRWRAIRHVRVDADLELALLHGPAVGRLGRVGRRGALHRPGPGGLQGSARVHAEGTDQGRRPVKVRWLVNLGRGPYLADDCSDEEIVAAFDEEYGGVSSAITAGLLQYFRKANDRVGKEYAEIDMRVTNGAVHCTAIQRFQGRDSIFTEGCSLVGAMNGLRARGYDSQPSSTTSHLHLIRRQYAMLLPRAESVFIPSENDIMAKKKDKTKTQVAAVLFAEDSQEPVAVLAPTEFGSDGGTGSDHFNLTVIKPVCIHTWRKINGFDNLLIANEGENFAVLKATYFAGIEDMDIEGVAIDEISMARVYSRIVRRI